MSRRGLDEDCISDRGPILPQKEQLVTWKRFVLTNMNVHCVALLISLLTIWRSLLFDLSFFALSCLIVDHLLCPENETGPELNLRQALQTEVTRSCRSLLHCSAISIPLNSGFTT